jgi:thioredoxin-like negative regulator of GroEL
MSRWLGALVTLACMSGNPVSSETPLDSEIRWITRTSAAFAEASRSGKPVLLDLWAVWCEPCKLMEQTTYRDPRVIQAVANFVPLKVNADANEVIVERYEVDAYPTTLFLDHDGDEIARRTGMLTADDLLGTLEPILAGYESYRTNVALRGDPAALQGAARFLTDVGNERGAARILRRALKAARKNQNPAAEPIELDLAIALLGDGQAGAAVKTMERLSASAASDEVRGRALVNLVRAERERGRERKAEQALERLRDEHPELASSLEP